MTKLNERLIKLSIDQDIVNAANARTDEIGSNFDIYGKMLAYDYESIIDESCVAVTSIILIKKGDN